MGGRIRLIGDIGGTNARFALAEDGKFGEITTLAGSDHAKFEDAIEHYLRSLGEDRHPLEAAFAIAGPVEGETVTFTNHPWSFTKSELKSRFDFARLDIVNDFAANALGVPYLVDSDLTKIGEGERKPGAPIGVIGPGTGLGVAGLIAERNGNWIPIPSEGGHATMPATSDREAKVLDILRNKYGHVSAERVLSGDGLVNLYESLCRIDGKKSAAYKPAQITDVKIGGEDEHCAEAVQMFSGMLGGVAGNLALTLGAGGGIFIAGGIVPRLGDRFTRSSFRTKFEEKGRLEHYLQAIASYVVTHSNPAMLGLANLP